VLLCDACLQHDVLQYFARPKAINEVCAEAFNDEPARRRAPATGRGTSVTRRCAADSRRPY
ncbi:MAG: hypothetical protein WAO16_16965, partial [Pseudolabrys sp.]